METVLSSITQITEIELMSTAFCSMFLHPLSRPSPVTLISAGSIAEDSSIPRGVFPHPGVLCVASAFYVAPPPPSQQGVF